MLFSFIPVVATNTDNIVQCLLLTWHHIFRLLEATESTTWKLTTEKTLEMEPATFSLYQTSSKPQSSPVLTQNLMASYKYYYLIIDNII